MTKNAHFETSLTPTNPYVEREERFPVAAVGCNGEYQLIFVGSPIRALLDEGIAVGEARVRQTEQPVLHQATDVMYAPGPLPVERSVMHRLFTRPGQLLTLATIPFVVPEFGIKALFERCQRKAEEALAAVALVLDERLSDRRVGERAIVSVSGRTMYLDVTRAVRTFDTRVEESEATTEALAALATTELGSEGSSLRSALRLYLRGTEKRLTQDGFILLAAAVDELVAKRRKMKAHDIHDALVEAGERNEDWSIPRLELLRTVRGKLIHNGMAEIEEMYTAWYDIEEVLRILLRHRAGIRLGWPTRVPMYEGPMLGDAVADVEDEPASASAVPLMQLVSELESSALEE